ncbi:MAG TPA: DUF3382 domain-containing protein, partial [Eoetvoesiella sp.]
MGNNFKNAFIAAIMAGVIIAPVFGLQIVRQGMQSRLEPEWHMIAAGMVIVFVFQLFRPFVSARLLHGSKSLPALPV